MSCENLIEWAKNYGNGIAMEALPITDKELVKIPRAYLSNVIYTIVGDPFRAWTDQRINERNQKVT